MPLRGPVSRTADAIGEDSTHRLQDSAIGRLSRWLFDPVDIASLVFFRVTFGAIMFLHVLEYFVDNNIREFYIEPKFHFSFYGFGWIQPLPGNAMYVLFVVLGMLAVCVALGLFYRVAAAFLCIGLTYVFLLDRVNYVNHDYLFCLISLIMAIVPAHRSHSLDVRRNPSLQSDTVPGWTLWLLRFQVGVPYFFGGLAKFDGDWLRAIPTRMMLENSSHSLLRAAWFPMNAAAWFLSYFGLLFDLAVVPLLLWRTTRPFALALAILFHLTNAWLFDIEMFPWFMIPATLIFLPPDWPRTVARNLRRWRGLTAAPTATRRRVPTATPMSTAHQKWTVVIFAFYVAVQLAFPLRYWFYDKNPNWTWEFHRFSWRMMLHVKDSVVQFHGIDRATGREWIINPQLFLTPTQIHFMSRDPDLIQQFAIFLARGFRDSEGADVEIHVQSQASLNGRPFQPLIDPAVDLESQPRSLRPAPWIMPLRNSQTGAESSN